MKMFISSSNAQRGAVIHKGAPLPLVVFFDVGLLSLLVCIFLGSLPFLRCQESFLKVLI